jgi:hypothetical protein
VDRFPGYFFDRGRGSGLLDGGNYLSMPGIEVKTSQDCFEDFPNDIQLEKAFNRIV